MCLGIPGKVIEIAEGGTTATVELFGARVKVALDLVEGVEPGDYVLIHAGYALQKLNLEHARENLGVWEEYLCLHKQG